MTTPALALAGPGAAGEVRAAGGHDGAEADVAGEVLGDGVVGVAGLHGHGEGVAGADVAQRLDREVAGRDVEALETPLAGPVPLAVTA